MDVDDEPAPSSLHAAHVGARDQDCNLDVGYIRQTAACP